MTSFRALGPLVGLSLGAAISMTARSAAACSCPGSVLLSPKAGSTDVPLNPAIVIASWQTPVALFDTSQNLEVPATVEPFAGLARVWLIRPNQALAPNTTYGVGASGAPGSWSFTTGTTTDHEPPGYVELTSFAAETAGPFSDSCSAACLQPIGRRMKFDFSPPPADTSLLLLEIRVADTTLSTIPIYRYAQEAEWPRMYQSSICRFDGASFGSGEEICARIVALDVAGQRSEASPEICTRVSACPPPASNSCEWVPECSLRDAGSGDAGAGDGGATDAPLPPSDIDSRGCSMSANGSRSASPAALLAVFAAMVALARRRDDRHTTRAAQ